MTISRRDATHSPPPQIWLKIQRGQTRFPRRPLVAERTLIGSGSTCYLQLGGEGIPMVHSLIVQDQHVLTIEALVAEPPLLVNSLPCRRASLQAGDTIGIGPFLFDVVIESREDGDLPDKPSPHWETEGEQREEGELASLSIESLVNQLESDMRMVEDFESGRRRGLIRLLRAARSQSSERQKVTSPPVLRLADHRPIADSAESLQRKAA